MAVISDRPPPFVDGAVTFVGGAKAWFSGETAEVTSPIHGADGRRTKIGSVAHMTPEQGQYAINAAYEAFGRGLGVWPTLSLQERMSVVRKYLAELPREPIVDVLMWEICKNASDAAKEFDRTIEFCHAVIAALEVEEWNMAAGVVGKTRKGPVGVCLMVAPFNYPLNEMYAMMIPALLMGNTIVLKLPTIGGLAHVLTIDALERCFPPGVVNFVTGSGRSTLPPIMECGKVDMIGYIGGKVGLDVLVRAHPEPHRLKVFSQLEGNNMAVILPSADLDVTVKEVVTGAFSYNGQRCTAVKLVLVHRDIVDVFVPLFVEAVSKLKVGLPWDAGVSITPLPDEFKPAYLDELVDDAVEKGASVVCGGLKCHTLLSPTVLYPVDATARIFDEEQFGPVIPVATFDNLDSVLDVAAHSWNGQQIAIFGNDPDDIARLVDNLQAIMGRINLNCAPSRGPDVFPFSGRRSSAMGTMSVTHAANAFSIETIVAYKANNADSARLATHLDTTTAFFAPLTK